MSTTITTEGNVTADPEPRFTKTTGQAVCTLRLAASSRRKNLDGGYEDSPAVFYEATCWGKLAENVTDSAVRKGDRLLVHGSTYDEEWTDREGGTRVRHVIQVSAIGISLRYAAATVHRTSNNQVQADTEPEPAPAA